MYSWDLVERKGEPVGSIEVVGDDVARSRRRIDAVHVAAADLALGTMALVVAVDAVRRVGEPHRPVGVDDDVVRAVQPPAVVTVGKYRDRAVVLGAGDPAIAVFAADQPALAVDRVAVGVTGWMAEHADGPTGLVPPQDAVVGDVADEQVAARRHVHRALRPAAPEVEALDVMVALDVGKPLVEDLELRGDRFGTHGDRNHGAFALAVMWWRARRRSSATSVAVVGGGWLR